MRSQNRILSLYRKVAESEILREEDLKRERVRCLEMERRGSASGLVEDGFTFGETRRRWIVKRGISTDRDTYIIRKNFGFREGKTKEQVQGIRRNSQRNSDGMIFFSK